VLQGQGRVAPGESSGLATKRMSVDGRMMYLVCVGDFLSIHRATLEVAKKTTVPFPNITNQGIPR
jgi:hypothetical protein